MALFHVLAVALVLAVAVALAAPLATIATIATIAIIIAATELHQRAIFVEACAQFLAGLILAADHDRAIAAQPDGRDGGELRQDRIVAHRLRDHRAGHRFRQRRVVIGADHAQRAGVIDIGVDFGPVGHIAFDPAAALARALDVQFGQVQRPQRFWQGFRGHRCIRRRRGGRGRRRCRLGRLRLRGGRCRRLGQRGATQHGRKGQASRRSFQDIALHRDSPFCFDRGTGQSSRADESLSRRRMPNRMTTSRFPFVWVPCAITAPCAP